MREGGHRRIQRPMYRPGSRRVGPPPWGYCQMRLAASQTRQSPCAFTLDQCLERLADQRGLLLEAGECPSLRQQFIIQREGRAHVSPFQTKWHNLLVI